MPDEERKPWVLPVFFGLLIALVWLVMDLMTPPKSTQAAAPGDDSPPASAEAASPTAAVLESPTSAP